MSNAGAVTSPTPKKPTEVKPNYDDLVNSMLMNDQLLKMKVT
jgi:hypothetical protein